MKIPIYFQIWTWRDSNPRPLRCERNDLPLIYKPEKEIRE
jgi:hypothetical protein